MFSASPELIMEINDEDWRKSPAAAPTSLPSVLSPSGIMYVDETAARAAFFPQPTQSPTQYRPGSTGPSALTHSKSKTRPRAGSRSPTPSARTLQFDEISPLISMRTPPSIHSTPNLMFLTEQDQRLYTQDELEEVANQWRSAGAAGIQNARELAFAAMRQTADYMDRKAAHDIAAAISETREDLTHEYVHELQGREEQLQKKAQKYAQKVETQAKSYATRVEFDAARKVDSVQQQAEHLHAQRTETLTNEAWDEIRRARAESTRMQLMNINDCSFAK